MPREVAATRQQSIPRLQADAGGNSGQDEKSDYSGAKHREHRGTTETQEHREDHPASQIFLTVEAQAGHQLRVRP